MRRERENLSTLPGKDASWSRPGPATRVSATSLERLRALLERMAPGAIFAPFLEIVREVGLRCPQCGFTRLVQLSEERVVCIRCRQITDWYEAHVQSIAHVAR